MQLILDADDIDIKGNMSAIEQESLNEKFLANKIIDHLADDITSGNKENIQKQDNIIPDPSENDITDTDKDITTDHVILPTNINEESSNEAVGDTESLDNLKEVVSSIDTCKTDPKTACDDPIVEIIENKREESQVVDDVILEKEQNLDDNQKLEKENESSIISHDNISTNDACSTQKETNDVELLIKGNEENEVDTEKDASVKLMTEGNEEQKVDFEEGVSLKVTREEKEEQKVDLEEGVSLKLTTEENEEQEVDLDEDVSVKLTTEEKEEQEVELGGVSVKVTTENKNEKEENVNKSHIDKVSTVENGESQVVVDKVDIVNVITEQKENKEVEIDKEDAVEVTTENNDNHIDVDEFDDVTRVDDKEKKVAVIEKEVAQVATENKESLADLNKNVNTASEDFVTDRTDISNTDIDDKSKEMECSVVDPDKTNSLNENNTPIEIDDEDEKTTGKNSSPNAEVLAIDENMEVEESEETMDVQELDGNIESQEIGESTQDKIISIQEPKSPQKDTAVVKKAEEEPKRICKLSNNLDIFSDEEEEDSPVTEPPKDDIPSTREKCISIDDDDDIMLIDEVTNEKEKEDNTIVESTTNTTDNIEPILENTINENVCTETVQNEENVPSDTVEPSETDVSKITESDQTVTNDVPSNETSEVTQDKVPDALKVKKPLLPKHFIKTCKKNLADMTRDDLEDFCVLKIVESIVDRSNLGEIKTQLKNLTQTMDECKKKCLMLSKQNKDLQVVLKSVQEEQKGVPDVHVTPLKITRSVGMQVVMMVDKPNARKKLVSPASFGSTNINTNIKQIKPSPNTNNRNKEKNTNNQQIPVPRLVPAVTTAKSNQTVANNVAKHNNILMNTPPIPNGVRNSPPVQKMTEKRPRSQAVTVDLTDDEPPAKLPTILRGGVNQTLRFSGPPPNIMQPQRFSAASMNSPRKVYIPISGAQAQNVRPGQTIMVKTVPAMGPRPRCPTPHVAKGSQNANQVRMGRIQPNRHPAPLPDAMKQYQPPNWKALPPAPDLKLSKVENGIVISWRIDGYQEENHEEIASYQLYAYQETSAPPSTTLWKKIGDVKALPLPMACTLTQFMAGYKYYFAVRAVDIRTRFGPFSLPGSILLLNKM